MGAFRSFEEITAWQKGRELVREVYRVTSTGSFSKDYGLRDQIRRAAVSVVSNVAEGFERGGNKEFIQYLYHAKGSCGEVRTQLYVSRDLEYLSEDTFKQLRKLTIRTSELIWGLIRYLKETELKGNKYK